MEALNLKGAIMFLNGDKDGAREIIKKVPVISEGGTDPVTFHNIAIFNVD